MENINSEKTKKLEKKKGGRPKSLSPAKIIKKIRVTDQENKLLLKRASTHSMSVTSYIKTFALSGKLIVKHKTVNQEIVAMIAVLKNIGNNVNSLAHKNNRGDFLTQNDKVKFRQWLVMLNIKIDRLENYFYDSES